MSKRSRTRKPGAKVARAIAIVDVNVDWSTSARAIPSRSASACPVGALYKTEAGPVAYEYEKCMGCRYCMVACPFSVPRYEWASLLPRVRKCQMCADRVAQGRPTACSEACPAEATMFGEREEMIALARNGSRKARKSTRAISTVSRKRGGPASS